MEARGLSFASSLGSQLAQCPLIAPKKILYLLPATCASVYASRVSNMRIRYEILEPVASSQSNSFDEEQWFSPRAQFAITFLWTCSPKTGL